MDRLHYTGAQLRFAFVLLVEQDARPRTLLAKFEKQLMKGFLNKGVSNAEARAKLNLALRHLCAGHPNTLIALGLQPLPPEATTGSMPLRTTSTQEAARLRQLLDCDPKQARAAMKVLASVASDQQCFIFINGRAGTGKTTLANYVSHFCATESLVCLNCATSGQAALHLLDGGTAHALFGIPVNDEEDLTCTVSPTCAKADVLLRAKVIQWDEFPMAKRTSWDAVLRLLGDVRTARPNDYVAKAFV